MLAIADSLREFPRLKGKAYVEIYIYSVLTKNLFPLIATVAKITIFYVATLWKVNPKLPFLISHCG